MNNKRIRIFLTGISLLAVLTTTACSAANVSGGPPSLVGTWNHSVLKSEGNPRAPFQAMFTINADGNMVEVSMRNPAITGQSRGVWSGSGNTYQLMFEFFTFDEQGKNTGKARIFHAIQMDGPDRFTSTYTGDLIDLAGKVTKKFATGTTENTRMKLEKP